MANTNIRPRAAVADRPPALAPAEPDLVGFFVSQTDGNDTYDGTQQTHTTGTTGPWKTLNKVNNSSFSPDDHIYLKRGDTWREGLVPPSEGTSGHQITFGAYGSGAMPRILGSNALGAWSDTGGNVWNATLTKTGTHLVAWFVHGDDTVTWGNKAANLGALAAEYDWFWAANVLSVYSPTNPDTRYSNVEVVFSSAPWYGISGKAYNTVENIEVAYWGYYGISFGVSSDCIVDSCHVHHIGVKNAAEAEGIAFYACQNSIARNNIVHDTGNHGIQTSCSNAAYSTLNILIEHNTVYDSHHSMIDNQCQNGTVNGVVIRYNYVYISPVYDKPYGGGAIWVLGEFGHAMAGFEIYGNVIYNLEGPCIIIRDLVTSPQIYNNTIWGADTTLDNSSSGIAIFSLGTYFPSGCIVKNNAVANCYNYSFATTASYMDVVDNNCWWHGQPNTNCVKIGATSYTSAQLATYRSATGYDTNGTFADPLFVDPSTQNFHLQSGSPCRDTGVDVGIAVDYDGVAIPQNGTPDMGAFEYV